MSRAAVIGGVAAASLAIGAGLAVWATSSLAAEGAFLTNGARAGHLDFTAGVLLLVGVALLITGFVLGLAALAEIWFQAQDPARRPQDPAEPRASDRAEPVPAAAARYRSRSR